MTDQRPASASMVHAITLGIALGAGGMARLAAQMPNPTVFSPGVISGPANDLSPAFTPDGKTVFFTRANSSQSLILVSHLSGGKWSAPAIASFSGKWRDLEPTMAPDGSYLIFASNRPATAGGKAIDAYYNGAAQPGIGGNLWRVDRTPNGWSEPHRLPDVVNSNGSIFSPSIAADGSLYFMKPVGTQTRFHIFRAQFSRGTFARKKKRSATLLPCPSLSGFVRLSRQNRASATRCPNRGTRQASPAGTGNRPLVRLTEVMPCSRQGNREARWRSLGEASASERFPLPSSGHRAHRLREQRQHGLLFA